MMTDPDLLEEYERRFRQEGDFWNFERSPYERAKRQATVEACGPQLRYRTLELGAANGVLAEALVARTQALVAIEGTPTAAAMARDRLARFGGVEVIHGLIPGDVPPGPYDLIVASEILYYLDDESYRLTLEGLESWLAPGGRLVAVHWRPLGPERPRSAQSVHEALRALPFLTAVDERSTGEYYLDVLERT
jgi:SAM-dependent methyltransferase